MSQLNYNRRNSNPPKPLTEKIANDLPNGYLKAGLDLYNGLGDGGKALLLGGIAVGLFAWLKGKK